MIVKKLLMPIGTIIVCVSLVYAIPRSSSDRIKVDGISGNDNVILTGRQPVFSWDFTFDTGYDQDTVEIQIGSSAGASDIWDFSDTVLVSRQVYTGTTILTPNTLYYWRIRVTDDLGQVSAWVASTFQTASSPVSLSATEADLKIDWNNPFNPSAGQKTTIRYQLVKRSETAYVRVYTINGELVVTLAEHLAEEGALYSVDWDGRNAEGQIVASGMYLVNLKAGSDVAVTRRVVVVK
ncbi:MAG: T9SS type A sorting domain-containing protein [Elusimicrobia bacterium]|nr:T9SS type A sorting domain-containing protein [Elusimicrobiota bacterium]MBD3411737.1 T9SS type A sorting domain-containing protein [Elusimicrobiota bacterium]